MKTQVRTCGRSTALWLCTLMLIAFAVQPAMAQAPSGAIFTTDSTGTLVNGNIYTDKGQVYLNGGPPPQAPCTAAGL
ncbi:MAG TPA: hypothetical protein VE734_08960, partial [Terriglobales bacterium]|nr:hypothetical protein [Terriglobales bacterium]